MKGHCVRRFHRRKFHAAGVNDVWAQDQHDKWGPRFGLSPQQYRSVYGLQQLVESLVDKQEPSSYRWLLY